MYASQTNVIYVVEISRDGDIAEEEPVKSIAVPLTARHQIFTELQQTEKNYCDTLNTLIKVMFTENTIPVLIKCCTSL